LLHETHPELRVDLITGVRSLDIARREADLAVRFARPSASVSSVITEAFRRQRRILEQGIAAV
jgi:DNA-binding transcriptional LysR family regulator